MLVAAEALKLLLTGQFFLERRPLGVKRQIRRLLRIGRIEQDFLLAR